MCVESIFLHWSILLEIGTVSRNIIVFILKVGFHTSKQVDVPNLLPDAIQFGEPIFPFSSMMIVNAPGFQSLVCDKQ